jgi:probable F420-dependent oxidoreductase
VSMRFGVGFPSCREGTAYPVNYSQPRDFPRIARRAEELGYDSLWANDHISTPGDIRSTMDEAPRFFEPLITYASVIGVTERIRLVCGVIVVPEREPVLLAKQAATLDVLSDGRLVLGVGIGSSKDEFEAVCPRLKGANRGTILDESIEAMRLLFSERSASYEGKYVQFKDIELAPKPVQERLPIYISAYGPVGLKRVARLADGWIVGAPPGGDALAVLRGLHEAANEIGRDPQTIAVNFQVNVCFGKDQAAAEEKLLRSQHIQRAWARRPDQSREEVLERFRRANPMGSPQQIVDQLAPLQAAGDVTMALIFLGQTVDELMEDMERFAQEVMPHLTTGVSG